MPSILKTKFHEGRAVMNNVSEAFSVVEGISLLLWSEERNMKTHIARQRFLHLFRLYHHSQKQHGPWRVESVNPLWLSLVSPLKLYLDLPSRQGVASPSTDQNVIFSASILRSPQHKWLLTKLRWLYWEPSQVLSADYEPILNLRHPLHGNKHDGPVQSSAVLVYPI